MSAGPNRAVVSLQTPVGEDGGTLADFITFESPSVEDEVDEVLTAEALRDAIARLPEPERYMIELQFVPGAEEPLTLRQAAKRLGVSREHARELEQVALERLQRRRDLQALRH